MTLLAWLVRRSDARTTPKQRAKECSPVEGLQVEVDGATTGESDGERLVVGVAEGDHTAVALAGQHLDCGGDHRTFDATTRHGARNLAVVAHRHGRTGIAGRRALQCDHARD